MRDYLRFWAAWVTVEYDAFESHFTALGSDEDDLNDRIQQEIDRRIQLGDVIKGFSDVRVEKWWELNKENLIWVLNWCSGVGFGVDIRPQGFIFGFDEPGSASPRDPFNQIVDESPKKTWSHGV